MKKLCFLFLAATLFSLWTTISFHHHKEHNLNSSTEIIEQNRDCQLCKFSVTTKKTLYPIKTTSHLSSAQVIQVHAALNLDKKSRFKIEYFSQGRAPPNFF